MIRHTLAKLIVVTVAFGHLAVSLAAEKGDIQQSDDELVVETIYRIKNFDLNSSDKAKAAVRRYLQVNKGSKKYFELVERFGLREMFGDLVDLAITQPEETAGISAATTLVRLNELQRLQETIEQQSPSSGANIVKALGHVAEKPVQQLLTTLASEVSRPREIRIAAVTGLGRSRQGQRVLLNLAAGNKLATDLHFTVANTLHSSSDPLVRKEIGKYLTMPASVNSSPLPPIRELLDRKGDISRGKMVFATAGSCAKCHQVGSEGSDVGPNLSEIGSKMGREALFLAILDPDAAISPSYELFSLELTNGLVVTGLITNKTDTMITLTNSGAIVQEFPRSKIARIDKRTSSLMPTNLQANMTATDLVDLVEYMTTLRKEETSENNRR